MAYVEEFIIAVPAANKETYLKHAAEVTPFFKELGATRVVECWGDDVPEGKLTDFRRAVQAKDDEVVAFSWIEYHAGYLVRSPRRSAEPAWCAVSACPSEGLR